MNTGHSGFHNAPVSKVLVIACSIASLLGGTRAAKGCSLSYQAIVEKYQFWRILTSSCVFASTPELIFGLFLIYYFRIFERQIGSNKYAVFLTFSTILSTVLNLVAIYCLKDLSPLGLSPGPYGLVFASFIQFYFDIPTTTRFRVFGASLSDKSFVYLAGLQLLVSSWKRTLIPGMCGFLAGAVYHINVLKIRRVKFPEALASATGRSFGALFQRVESPASRENSRSSQNAQGHLPPLIPSVPVLLPPPEESVAMLVSMGFDRNRAVQALTEARNDVTRATNLLVEGQA